MHSPAIGHRCRDWCDWRRRSYELRDDLFDGDRHLVLSRNPDLAAHLDVLRFDVTVHHPEGFLTRP